MFSLQIPSTEKKNLRHLHLGDHAKVELLYPHDLADTAALATVPYIGRVICAGAVAFATDMMLSYREMNVRAGVHVLQVDRHVDDPVWSPTFLRRVTMLAAAKKATLLQSHSVFVIQMVSQYNSRGFWGCSASPPSVSPN